MRYLWFFFFLFSKKLTKQQRRSECCDCAFTVPRGPGAGDFPKGGAIIVFSTLNYCVLCCCFFDTFSSLIGDDWLPLTLHSLHFFRELCELCGGPNQSPYLLHDFSRTLSQAKCTSLAFRAHRCCCSLLFSLLSIFRSHRHSPLVHSVFSLYIASSISASVSYNLACV